MSQPDASAALIELSDVRKSYNIGLPSEAEILHGLSLRVNRGEFIALIGPSGSGKSTLLNIVGLLERMTSGGYRLQGEEVNSLDDAELTRRRRTTLGFVFQFHHLLPAFTALENVTLPALMSEGHVSAQQLARARELLDAVGLAQAMNKRPAELSGGMQQRVAIARALVQAPDNSAGRLFMACARPTASSSSRARASCCALTWPSLISAGRVTFSSAVKAGSRW